MSHSICFRVTGLGLAAVLAISSLRAAELPELVIPAGVGVNIHFTTGHQTDLDKIQAGGFKFIRMDFAWGGIERAKGQYDWSAYDELTTNLEKHGLRAYYILDYSNPLYEETVISKDPLTGKEQSDVASPRHPESVAAFAAWAAAAAKHFAGRHVIWEIWNEPNIEFWKPRPDAREYAALLLAAAKAVRASDAQATIVGPASSAFPWKFIETFFAAGALEYLDAVSVHPYREAPPETAAADYLKLRVLIARYAPAGKANLPILSGEWGYATPAKGIPLEQQAAYFVRQQLANLLAGVPLSIWYDWKNDGPDVNYGEHNFGTVTADLKAKPSYEAAQVLVEQLSGYRIARRLATTNAEDFALLAVNGAGAQKIVVWTRGAPHELSLDCGTVQSTAVRSVGGRGEPVKVSLAAGRLGVEANASPKYITLPDALDAFSGAAAWQATLPNGALVKAGPAGGVRVNVWIKNPFARPVRIDLATEGSHANPPTGDQFTLAAGEVHSHAFELSLPRQDASNGQITVRVKFSEADGRLICSSSDQLPFMLRNPLGLSVAPTEMGCRVRVENPAGEPFSGELHVGAAKSPVVFAGGVTELTVNIPAPLRPSTHIELVDTKGRLLAEATSDSLHPINITNWRAALDGDEKIPASAKITLADAPGAVPPFGKAFKLEYEFGDGWRFVRCLPATGELPAIEGRPQALGVWVHAENSGHSLRVRLQDASGQTFQYSGPTIDWTGWRWVNIDLADAQKTAAHWGGPNDGSAHGNLHWDSPLLIDGTRTKTSGVIYFADPVLVYP